MLLDLIGHFFFFCRIVGAEEYILESSEDGDAEK